jgi:hypothetical protein
MLYRSKEKKISVRLSVKKKISVAQKKRLSENNPLVGFKHETITGPHCKKSGGLNAMKRWHFNNCKQKNGE